MTLISSLKEIMIIVISLFISLMIYEAIYIKFNKEYNDYFSKKRNWGSYDRYLARQYLVYGLFFGIILGYLITRFFWIIT